MKRCDYVYRALPNTNTKESLLLFDPGLSSGLRTCFHLDSSSRAYKQTNQHPLR